MRRATTALLLLTAGLHPLPSAAQADVSASLERAAGAIRTTFMRGEAGALRPALPARGKVMVAIPSLGISAAYLGPSQCPPVLAEMFRAHPIVEFSLGRTEREGGGARMQGRLTVRRGEATVSIPIGFLLQQETGGWVVREIRERGHS